MTAKSKTLLIIVCTLILGIVLGAVGSGALVRQHLQAFGGPPTPERMVRLFDRFVDLEESQRDTVETILRHSAEQFIEMNERHWSELQPLMDSLRLHLSHVLTEDQIRRLEQAEEQAQNRFGRPKFFGPRPFPKDRRPPLDRKPMPGDSI